MALFGGRANVGAPGGNAVVSGATQKSGNKPDAASLSRMLNRMNLAAQTGGFFKANPNGTVRFRLARAQVSDELLAQDERYGDVITLSSEHWVTTVGQDGQPRRNKVVCYSVVDEPCPLCALHGMLAGFKDVPFLSELHDGQSSIRQSIRFMGWVLDRTYMLAGGAYDPRKDTIQPYNSIPRLIGVGMAHIMAPDGGGWGDASDPVNGYDFTVTGSAPGGVVARTKYSVINRPQNESPGYNPSVMDGRISPFQHVVSQLYTREKLEELLEILLAGIIRQPRGNELYEQFNSWYSSVSEGGVADEEPYTPPIAVQAQAAPVASSAPARTQPPAGSYSNPPAVHVAVPAPMPQVEPPTSLRDDEEFQQSSEDDVEGEYEEEAPVPVAPPAPARAPRKAAAPAPAPAAPSAVVPPTPPIPQAPAAPVSTVSSKLSALQSLKSGAR